MISDQVPIGLTPRNPPLLPMAGAQNSPTLNGRKVPVAQVDVVVRFGLHPKLTVYGGESLGVPLQLPDATKLG